MSALQRIRLKTGLATTPTDPKTKAELPPVVFDPGMEVDWERADAQRLIQRGYAEAVEPKAK